MNTKKDSYLSERKYSESKEVNEAKIAYWKDILGEEVTHILGKEQEFLGYISEGQFEAENNVNKNKIFNDFLQLSHKEKKRLVGRIQGRPQFLFSPFYMPIIESAAAELQNRIKKLYCFKQDIIFDFAEVLYQNLQSICMRTLIMSMHREKEKGLLIGKDSKEEYLFFCSEIISKHEFSDKLLEEYPVLRRCIYETVEQRLDFFVQVIVHYEQDIQKLLHSGAVETNGKKTPIIEEIKSNFSDTHRKGRQVLKIKLSNGQWIFYKPRSMDNEAIHFELLEWLEKETGIEQKKYSFYSAEDHSWSAVVEKAECHSEAELKEYYRRLGTQLFLAYILGTKDLHSENLIASGAYPVLVDLETLVNLPTGQKRKTAEEEILYQLSYSVLYTGLLPFYLWGKEGKGVNCSAISGGEGQVYPFKIPAISNPGTSEMKIMYCYPRTEKSENLPLLNGKFEEPYLYEKELTDGFRRSYQAVCRKQDEFCRKTKRLANSSSRYLIADTQRYSMQLNSSFHPELLQDGAEREIFLYTMWMGRDWKDDNVARIVKSEIKELLCGNIPYFTYRLDNTSLYGTDEVQIKAYFTEPAIAKIKEKLKSLCSQDLERQIELIKAAMTLMPQNKERLNNGIYKKDSIEKVKQVSEKERIEAIHKVVNHIMEAAIYNKEYTDVSWYGVCLAPHGQYKWEIKPMNMYFYGGIAGMAVAFHIIHINDKRKAISRIVSLLDKKLITYTIQSKSGGHRPRMMLTGMYEGEASIVYAYLCLYKIEKEKKYLKYAGEHSQIIESLMEEDQSYDLLSGNAGTANVLIELYEITREIKYLRLAQKASAILEAAAVEQKKGVGWITENGIKPMAGMAHGNSGILIPFVKLWAYTHEKHYLDFAGRILEYENTLYDENIQNWKDMRGEGESEGGEDKHGAVAWCHGAAGILMSRMICLDYVKSTNLERFIKRDIERALSKVRSYPVRDSWTLCHGTCGNAMILWEAMKRKIVKQNMEDIKFVDNYFIRCILEDRIRVLPQEELNFGLMNGWAGMVCILENNKSFIPLGS